MWNPLFIVVALLFHHEDALSCVLRFCSAFSCRELLASLGRRRAPCRLFGTIYMSAALKDELGLQSSQSGLLFLCLLCFLFV